MTIELLETAETLRNAAISFKDTHEKTLKAITDAATRIHKSWSGSNLGYHAQVYYRDLAIRPPGAQFSAEWGLRDMSLTGMGSVGDWCEYDSDAVKEATYELAGSPDLEQAKTESADLSRLVKSSKEDLLSELSLNLAETSDEFLSRLKQESEQVELPSFETLCRATLPSGQMMSRDSNAVMAGLQVAPHHEVLVEAASLQVPVDGAIKLAEIAEKAGSHIERKKRGQRRMNRVGTNVFIGHGRSSLWRELKDFVVDRLHLPYEEFNRVPVAGLTNIHRLSEMLDGAACALIVLTAEDEQADGKIHARMNVIHEVGLFQGRLGFTKAIVVLEEGCEEFSNIQGLGQIRFPTGNISAAFEEVRAVLEREEVI